MKIFLDSANLAEIKKAVATGILDGVTTNPSLLAKEAKSESVKETLEEILKVVPGDVSLEVIGTTAGEMISEGRELAKMGENVVVKLPMGVEGIKATVALTKENIKTNVTLVFSTGQALLAAKAGATYVSPFIGRLHDIGLDGTELVESIRTVFDNYGFATEILAASDRTILDTVSVAEIGADVITMKSENFFKLFEHPLTDIGLEKFLADWRDANA